MPRCFHPGGGCGYKAAMTDRPAPKWLRPATEYRPLIVFFAAFYAGGKDLITATAAFMVAVVLVVRDEFGPGL